MSIKDSPLPSQVTAAVGVLALLGCLFQTGCGGGAFPTAKVSGTIETESGEALPSGIITFTPLAVDPQGQSGKPAYGQIENGTFVLSTYGNGDGAVVGQHKVSLTEAWRPDEEYSDDRSEIPPRHGCEISPDSQEVEVVEGKENVLKLIAVRKSKRDIEEEEELDD